MAAEVTQPLQVLAVRVVVGMVALQVLVEQTVRLVLQIQAAVAAGQVDQVAPQVAQAAQAS